MQTAVDQRLGHNENCYHVAAFTWNLATLATAALTMSTVEIAARTEKTHGNVMRDARVMLDALGLPLFKFEVSYRAGNGKMEPCLNLPKGLTLTLVTGYSIPLRAAVVARWQELEAQQSPRIPTHPEALRLAADALEKAAQEEARANREESLKLIAQERVAVLEPMAAVGEAVVSPKVFLDSHATPDIATQGR